MEKIRISKALIDMKAKTIEEAIKELVNASTVSDKEEVIKAVLERERQSSTYIGDGVAVPHAKSSLIKSGEAVIGRSISGLEWGNGTSHIVILTLSSLDSAGPHVLFLADIMKIVSSASARAEIMEAQTENQLLEVFQGL